MKLSRLEQIYLKRYKLGLMDKDTFDLYLKKGIINKSFYNYVILNKID